MIAKKYICADIGKTKILMAVMRVSKYNYKIFDEIELKNPRNPKRIEKIMLDFCQTAQKKFWTKKVAVSAAHIVDPKMNKVLQGKDCYGTEIFSFHFLERKGFSVQIENDGHCFALGEYFFGKAMGTKIALALSLGTEIGGGLIHKGTIFRGFHNCAFEVSHICANILGPWQDWGILCAGKGIASSYRKKTGIKISTQEIFEKSKYKDKIAKDTIGQAAGILGKGTASLINIADPEIIVFGGSLAKQKKFVSYAVQTARKNIFNKKANYKFAISSLGNKANLLGAVINYKNLKK